MDLMLRAAQAYFDVLLAQDALATARGAENGDRRATRIRQAQF
jgi:outer membrane protein TolC